MANQTVQETQQEIEASTTLGDALPERFEVIPAKLLVAVLHELERYCRFGKKGRMVVIQDAGNGDSHIRTCLDPDGYQHVVDEP